MATTINLDRPRKLVFNVRALCAVEDHFKAGFNSILSDRMGLSTLSVLLWQGLKAEDPTLTLDKVMDLIDAKMKAGEMDDIPKAIGEAIEESGLNPKAKNQPGQ